MPPKVNILRDSSPDAITELVSLSGVGLTMTEKDKEQKRKAEKQEHKKIMHWTRVVWVCVKLCLLLSVSYLLSLIANGDQIGAICES
jgi:hypothetical protein